MSHGSPECAHARLQIGGDPHDLPPEVTAHLATCAACRQFHEETLLLDRRLRAALELPLAQFRTPPVAMPARRYALAASVALAVLLAGGFWVFKPQSALAGEVVAHVLDEGASWGAQSLLPAAEVANTLRTVGSRLQDAQTRVVEMSTEQVEQRVAHALLRLANQTGRKTDSGIEIDFPISRQDIAEMTGTTLHTVSRLLSKWEDIGIIVSGRQKVTVRDAHRLVVLAENRSKD